MKKALIIDDSFYTLTTHSELVTQEGMVPLVASGGEEALQIYRTEKPEIVLCDIMMPEMNGYEVCEALKEIDPNVFLYFVSAEMTEQARQRATALGAAGYFQKPISNAEIQTVVTHYESLKKNLPGGRAFL